MKKLIRSAIYLGLMLSITGCPKKADIIYRQEIAFLPDKYTCLMDVIKRFDSIMVKDIRDLKTNSPFNGYTIYLDTKHSSTDLTVYEPSSGEYIYDVSTWLQYDITEKERHEIEKLISKVTESVKETCLTKG